MEFLSGNLGTVLDIAVYTVALASVLATVTKTDKDDKIIGKISKVVNFLACNFGNAKNEKR